MKKRLAPVLAPVLTCALIAAGAVGGAGAARGTAAEEPVEAPRFEISLLSARGVAGGDFDSLDGRPLVLMMGGSEGGMYAPPRKVREALFAAGYDVATLAMFKTAALPRSLVRVPLDRLADRATDLRERFSKCIALIGISRGGEATLVIASRAPNAFAAYGAIVPAHAAGSALQNTLIDRPAWTWNGEDVPWVWLQRVSFDALGWVLSRGEQRQRFNYRIQSRLLEPEVMTSPARMKVERIERPLLLVSATKDQVWPSEPMATIVERTVRDAGKGELVRHERLETDHYVARHPRYASILVSWLRANLPTAARPSKNCR